MEPSPEFYFEAAREFRVQSEMWMLAVAAGMLSISIGNAEQLAQRRQHWLLARMAWASLFVALAIGTVRMTTIPEGYDLLAQQRALEVEHERLEKEGASALALEQAKKKVADVASVRERREWWNTQWSRGQSGWLLIGAFQLMFIALTTKPKPKPE